VIKRIWHGYTTPERADEYEALLRAEVIKGIEGKNIPGFRRIDVLRRPLADEVEFVTVMDFDGLGDVRAFVGEDYQQAYVPAEARAILSRFDERSQHYEVRESRLYGDEARAAGVTATDAMASSFATASSTSLQPDTWFVRKDRGRGSVPITRDGYKVAAKFVVGMLGWAVAAAAMAVAGQWVGPPWLTYAALPLFVLGTFLTAWYFIAMARKHTDTSITYNDYVKARRNA